MIGGLFAALARSAWARTVLRYGVTALAILLFLLALRRSGERTGRLDERLGTMERANDETDLMNVRILVSPERGDFSIKLEEQVLTTETGYENMTRYPFEAALCGVS